MLLEILILVLAVPAGFLIAWLARDELVSIRRWIAGLIVFSVVFGMGAYLFGLKEIGWTFGFIAIVSFVCYLKSLDKKWTKKKFK